MVHPKSNQDEMYIDIGAYGVPGVNGFDAIKTTRKIEEFVRRVEGYVRYTDETHYLHFIKSYKFKVYITYYIATA